MCKRVYLTAKEAEMEMQELRNKEGFTGKMETDYISRMIKDAKRNSMNGSHFTYINTVTHKRITINKDLNRMVAERLMKEYDLV